ncbi:hypothetical protein B0T25DRAFT_95257 [Lasiosphaeria hispida]|uniref:Uncharacterized protein n=1 Tax=Lasiosphaeria hispida TaxID=260671 RepID=A0AAJ0HQF6_9PEZI|nr:hypothetical protein B0T25DRAFT_95257 [Lasiosphaeria hispida]
MGGKIWNRDEERIFWRIIMAQGPKRVGIDRARNEVSWEDLSREMAQLMGDNARRDYTTLCLFEHYFLNIIQRTVSPNAGKYVKQYLNKMSKEEREAIQDEARQEALKREQKRAKRLLNQGSKRDKKVKQRSASAPAAGAKSETSSPTLSAVSDFPGNAASGADPFSVDHSNGSPSNASHSPFARNSPFFQGAPSTQGTFPNQPFPATQSSPVGRNSPSASLPGVSSLVPPEHGLPPRPPPSEGRFMPRLGHWPVQRYGEGYGEGYGDCYAPGHQQAPHTYYRPDNRPYYDPGFGHGHGMGPNFGHAYGQGSDSSQHVPQGHSANYGYQEHQFPRLSPAQQHYRMPDYASYQHAEPQYQYAEPQYQYAELQHTGSSQQGSAAHNAGYAAHGQHNAAGAQHPAGRDSLSDYPRNYSTRDSAYGSAPGLAVRTAPLRTPPEGTIHVLESIETPKAGETERSHSEGSEAEAKPETEQADE